MASTLIFFVSSTRWLGSCLSRKLILSGPSRQDNLSIKFPKISWHPNFNQDGPSAWALTTDDVKNSEATGSWPGQALVTA